MSGRKCSEFRLQREREEKLRLIQNLGNLHAEVNGLKERVTTALNSASEGLRTTFAEEVRHAQRWLDTLALPDIDGLGMDTDLTTLRATQSALEKAAALGREMQERLTVTFTQKADAIGQHLARRLAAVERKYIGRQQLLRLWCAENQMQRWERSLQETRELLKTEHYTTLEPLLETMEREILKSPVG
jgi:hypothetical protein